jgi:hypothetical protein
MEGQLRRVHGIARHHLHRPVGWCAHWSLPSQPVALPKTRALGTAINASPSGELSIACVTPICLSRWIVYPPRFSSALVLS